MAVFHQTSESRLHFLFFILSSTGMFMCAMFMCLSCIRRNLFWVVVCVSLSWGSGIPCNCASDGGPFRIPCQWPTKLDSQFKSRAMLFDIMVYRPSASFHHYPHLKAGNSFATLCCKCPDVTVTTSHQVGSTSPWK